MKFSAEERLRFVLLNMGEKHARHGSRHGVAHAYQSEVGDHFFVDCRCGERGLLISAVDLTSFLPFESRAPRRRT